MNCRVAHCGQNAELEIFGDSFVRYLQKNDFGDSRHKTMKIGEYLGHYRSVRPVNEKCFFHNRFADKRKGRS